MEEAKSKETNWKAVVAHSMSAAAFDGVASHSRDAYVPPAVAQHKRNGRDIKGEFSTRSRVASRIDRSAPADSAVSARLFWPEACYAMRGGAPASRRAVPAKHRDFLIL